MKIDLLNDKFKDDLALRNYLALYARIINKSEY